MTRAGAWRVGIDAGALANRQDGSRNHVSNVLQALARIDPGGAYTVFLHAPPASNSVPVLPALRQVQVPLTVGRWRVPLATSLALMGTGIDLLHVQFAAPILCRVPLIVTVHDIMYEHYPEYYAPPDLTQLRRRVPRTVGQARLVLTGSEFSKQDLIARYGVRPERIAVTSNGVEPRFAPVRDDIVLSGIRERVESPHGYILFVGALKPNKNLHRLIESYARLRETDRTRHKLVLAGASTDTLSTSLRTAIAASGFASDIVLPGYIADVDLPALYSAADLFVQPSLFEGFGLPPLEAMACGTAVVTSNTTSLPEVVGEAALTVDPTDVEALARAMAAVLDNDSLRRDLEHAGIARASTFTWERTARIVLDAYQTVAVEVQRGIMERAVQ